MLFFNFLQTIRSSITHETIWEINSKKGANVFCVKHWYKEQTMQIKWGKHFSEPFHVTNGVRQGGVWSPYLFAVYLDDLSTELNNIKAGCYIGEVSIILMFADDICVFCPSVRGLQSILDVCQAYTESHGINYFQLQQNCLYDI